MVVTIIALLLLLLLLALLLMPLEMYINTVQNQYYLQLPGLMRASLEGDEVELLRIRLQVLFGNFYFYPLRKKRAVATKNRKEQAVGRKRGRTIPFGKILRILQSFRVKKFWVDLDTGNCITNAKLYPAFAFLNRYRPGFHINFQGRTQMVLLLRNRPIHIITSFINL